MEETFDNLRKVNLKLNPEKCVFGVPSGKLLGFFVLTGGSKLTPIRSTPSRKSKNQGQLRM